MIARSSTSLFAFFLAGVSTGFAPVPLTAQRPASSGQQWVVPRTPDGHPDLQGNWTNATITPLQRPRGQGLVLTPGQVAEIEGRRQDLIDDASAPSDPNREAPPVGGAAFDGNVLNAGTGTYNYVYIDGGDRVAIYNGEPRSSLVTNPTDGRVPAFTLEEQQRRAEAGELNRQFGPYDNPENLSLADRCIMSFGSNAGPPMLPNGFYNNNYTIVQTADHIMILTEQVHDVRIIRMGERVPMPEHMRPWMGDSWGHWEGDTLVIETTNLSAKQANGSLTFPGGSDEMRVTERLTRVNETTINYEFTVNDPGAYTAEWGGEVPMKALDGLVYEYACHEGNYALGNILRGARYQERLDAENQN
jgi:hypothetical protein